MAKKKFSKQWVHDHINDPYVKMAQQKGYRARAAFKLIELLDAENLLKPGNVVVDLGAAPGSWSQVATERMHDKSGAFKGRVIALDILPMDPLPNVEFIQGDFRENDILEQLERLLDGSRVDLVISDMAPNLSGVKVADAARMQHMHELALDFARDHLKPRGCLIVKAFNGSGFSQTVELYRKYFNRVVIRKPKASRDKSSETFLISRSLK